MKLSKEMQKEADRQRGLQDYIVSDILEEFAKKAKELEDGLQFYIENEGNERA